MTDIPFGSMSNIQKAIIRFRKEWKTSPPPKRGKVETTIMTGEGYNYYLSEDVIDYASAFAEKNKLFLDLGTMTSDKSNETHVTLSIIDFESTEIDNIKTVSISIGRPTSTAELGARITYVQKYLVGLLFGVSVATDKDAFNNGIIIEGYEVQGTQSTTIPQNNSSISNHHTSSSGSVASVPDSSGDAGTGVDTDNSAGRSVAVDVEQARPVEPTRSYELAKTFIEKSLSQSMLDDAVTKVTNSIKMHDEEKAELLSLIEEKRKTVK